MEHELHKSPELPNRPELELRECIITVPLRVHANLSPDDSDRFWPASQHLEAHLLSRAICNLIAMHWRELPVEVTRVDYGDLDIAPVQPQGAGPVAHRAGSSGLSQPPYHQGL
jgi:hypothetical protein